MWLLPIILLGWSMPLTLSSKSAKLFKSPKLPIYETRHSYHDTSKSSKKATVIAISSKRLFSTRKSASKSYKHKTNPSATSTDDTPTDEPTDSPTKAPVTDEPTSSHNTNEPTHEPTSMVIIEATSVPIPEPTWSSETPAPNPCGKRKFFIITDMEGVKKCSNGMEMVDTESYDSVDDCCANIFVNPNFQEAYSACKYINVCNPSGEPSLSPTLPPASGEPTLSPVTLAPVTLAPIESKSLPTSVSSAQPTSKSTEPPTSEPIMLIVDENTGEVEQPTNEVIPTFYPKYYPTSIPNSTSSPTFKSTITHTMTPDVPTYKPKTLNSTTKRPSPKPTSKLTTALPIDSPTLNPVTESPTYVPTIKPSSKPTTRKPLWTPTLSPTTEEPSSDAPSPNPSNSPTSEPPISDEPTLIVTESLITTTRRPTRKPSTKLTTAVLVTAMPSEGSTLNPVTESPTYVPTYMPTSTSATFKPTTRKPSLRPTSSPTIEQPSSDAPSPNPSDSPTSVSPTSNEPTLTPTTKTTSPKPISVMPSESPTLNPVTASPTLSPTIKPLSKPTSSPTTTEEPSSDAPSPNPTSTPVTAIIEQFSLSMGMVEMSLHAIESEISLSMYTETTDFFSMSMEVLELSTPVYNNDISISMGAMEIPLELDDLRGEITSEPTSNEPTINPTYKRTAPWSTFELTSSPMKVTTKLSNRPSLSLGSNPSFDPTWSITNAPTTKAPTSDLFSMSMEVLELSTPVYDNEISISMSAIEIPLELNDLITVEPTTSSSYKPTTQKILVTEPPQSMNTPTSAIPTSTVPTPETLTSITPTSNGNYASYIPTTMHSEIDSSIVQLSTNNPSTIVPSLHYDSTTKPTTIVTTLTSTFKVNFQVLTDMPSSTTQVATATGLLSNQDEIVPPQDTMTNKFVSIDRTAVTVTVLMLCMLSIMLGLLVRQKRQISLSSSARNNTYISMNNSGLIHTDSIVDNEQYITTNIFESLLDRNSPIRTIASDVRNKYRQSETSDDLPPTEDELCQHAQTVAYDECASSVDQRCDDFCGCITSPIIIRPSTSEATDELLPVDVVYTYNTESAPNHSKKQQQVPLIEDTEDDVSLSLFLHSEAKQLVLSPRSEQSL